jgi:hypothetical protein
VCVENVVRFDLVRESVNDGREGRAERRSLEHVQLEWSWSGNARAPPNADRFLLIWLLSLVPFHSAIAILRPETIIRWHRPELGHIRGQAIVLAGRESRPKLRKLIGEMRRANHLSFPRIRSGRIRAVALRSAPEPKIACATTLSKRSTGGTKGTISLTHQFTCRSNAIAS